MHTVELYRKVRLACRDGMSERAAARHFGISRESVKKMLRFSVPPGYRRTAPVRRPKLDGFTEIIDRWLKEDLKQLRKQPPSPNTMLLPCARRGVIDQRGGGRPVGRVERQLVQRGQNAFERLAFAHRRTFA